MGDCKVSKDIKDMVEEVFGKTKMKIGAILEHPEYGRVIITDGQYWGTHGLSNFWYWKKVNEKNEPVGELFTGYGWC